MEKKSLFLLGPRATGKSFLIKQQLADQAYQAKVSDQDYKIEIDPVITIKKELEQSEERV